MTAMYLILKAVLPPCGTPINCMRQSFHAWRGNCCGEENMPKKKTKKGKRARRHAKVKKGKKHHQARKGHKKHRAQKKAGKKAPQAEKSGSASAE